MSKKPRFRTPMDSQHVKGCQTLVKSARRHFLQFLLIIIPKIELQNVSLSNI